VCWWVTSKKKFVYKKPRITNSLGWMAKQHQTNLKSKTYSMGKLTNLSYGVKIGMQNILWTIQPRCHLGKWSMTCMSQI
jgi:hypothetical protein